MTSTHRSINNPRLNGPAYNYASLVRCDDRAFVDSTAEQLASEAGKSPGSIHVIAGMPENGKTHVMNALSYQMGRYGLQFTESTMHDYSLLHLLKRLPARTAEIPASMREAEAYYANLIAQVNVSTDPLLPRAIEHHFNKIDEGATLIIQDFDRQKWMTKSEQLPKLVSIRGLHLILSSRKPPAFKTTDSSLINVHAVQPFSKEDIGILAEQMLDELDIKTKLDFISAPDNEWLLKGFSRNQWVTLFNAIAQGGSVGNLGELLTAMDIYYGVRNGELTDLAQQERLILGTIVSLAKAGEASVETAEIANGSGCDQHSVSTYCTRLTERGLLERSNSSKNDGRKSAYDFRDPLRRVWLSGR